MKNNKKYYSGIGSRLVPGDIYEEKMANIAIKLEDLGYVLRSGGAIGSDKFFENGIKNDKNKEIYRPSDNIPQKAFEIAEKFHPYWNYLKPYVKLLMARNAQIILGSDLTMPSKFVVCYTPEGKIVGGTGHSIKIAHAHNIPVYNLAIEQEENKLNNFIGLETIFFEN